MRAPHTGDEQLRPSPAAPQARADILRRSLPLGAPIGAVHGCSWGCGNSGRPSLEAAPAPAAASGAGAAASHAGRSAPPSSDAGRSHASAESRDTADELLDIFLDPAPPPKRLVRLIHPLVAYAFVLRYGRRIPGPMPGSLPDQGQEPPV